MEIYHKYFLQYMLKNGIKPINTALEFCKGVSKGIIQDNPKLKMMVVEINRQVSRQNYKIVIATCEVSGQEMVLFLNTRNDDISKLQLAFTTLELEYFHGVLQELVNSATHRMSYAYALNTTSNLTARLSRDDGQKALTKWFRGGYFVKIADYIYLGLRTILEFTSYLKSHCPEQICYLCSELVFTGRQCEQCDKIFHAHCLQKYFERQASCPSCKNEWVEAAEEESTRYTQRGQTQNMQEAEDETSYFQGDTDSRMDYSQEDSQHNTDGSSMVVVRQDNIYDNPRPSTSWDKATAEFLPKENGTRSSNRKRKSSKK